MNDKFTKFADWVSEFMGTPLNIGIWLVIVLIWFAVFAFGILTPNTNILPAWFTSNAFNFPLNSLTTLAELYIGFLIAAAANRVEKRNYLLHTQMQQLLERIVEIDEEEKTELDEISAKLK